MTFPTTFVFLLAFVEQFFDGKLFYANTKLSRKSFLSFIHTAHNMRWEKESVQLIMTLGFLSAWLLTILFFPLPLFLIWGRFLVGLYENGSLGSDKEITFSYTDEQQQIMRRRLLLTLFCFWWFWVCCYVEDDVFFSWRVGWLELFLSISLWLQ